MSTARGRDRLKPGGRCHLVLVRGELDRAEPVTMGGDPPHPPARPEDADWRAFCERIGWQHVEIALPDDYEDRLAARIFHEDALSRWGRERIPDAEWIVGDVDDGWPRGGPGVAPGGWLGARAPGPPRARRAFMAAAMAVAAVLCVAASVVLWRAARPPVGAVACPDVEAPPRATIAPVVDRAAPVDPSEQPRDPEPRSRPPRTKDAPTEPAPSETKPEKPATPGSLVAERSRLDGPSPPEASRRPGDRPRRSRVAMVSGLGSGPFTMGALTPDPRSRPFTMGALPPSPRSEPFTRPQSVALVPTLPMIPRAWPDTRPPDGWTLSRGGEALHTPPHGRPASFGQAVVPASASWSLSPTNPRWFGVGLPPSGASAGVPPGAGVMAQLDVGKALAGL
jgi:hypothetical protein